MPFDRPLPALSERNRFYWTSGGDGRLRLQRCGACGALQHPPVPECRHCGSGELQVTAVSGSGVVQSCTVNHQSWSPAMQSPYSVAVVALDEDPRVRITSNIVGCDPEEVHIGMPVRVLFEQSEDVWVPLFEPIGGERSDLADETEEIERIRSVRAMVQTDKFEDRVALTGIGMSRIGRKLMVDPLSLTLEACRSAVADAGLTLGDIDGLSTYPAGSAEGGHSEGGLTAVESALGLHPAWHNGAPETPGANGALIAAMLAVAGGLCRHVLCFRTVWESTNAELMRSGKEHPRTGRASGFAEFLAPYGAQPANTVAMAATQHFHRYGTTREALGWIALNARANAALNPTALYRDPLSMDDYMSARMVSTPLCLFDCDPLCDGSVAVVVSHAGTAADLAKPPVWVEAVGTQITERMEWDQGILSHEPHVLGPSAHLWTRTSLKPSDVDVAELYDGFSFNCLSWIEALGFCGIGQAQEFLDGGKRIALGGELAVNTHGGQLSHGRTHGMAFAHEAVTQLRGEAGERQVHDARTAVVTTGGLTPGAVILLRGSR